MDAFQLLDEPLWQVLYVFHHLMEQRTERALLDRRARVESGLYAAMAFNDPKQLADEIRDVQSAIRAHEDGPAVRDGSKGRALLERIQKGRVLDPKALVS